MGGWYWIGVAVGLGAAVGLVVSALLAGTRLGLIGSALVAGALGAAIGFAFGWPAAIGGGLGGICGAAGTAELVSGSLRRGGARAATAGLLTIAAAVLAALAFVPALGFLEALALPLLGLRMRGRTPRRYAGLRTLARD